MARFYADEDFPGPVVVPLRALGHDVLTAADDGRANAGIPDADVLARAGQLGRTVLTKNRRDFYRLHRANPGHAGIITIRDDPDRIDRLANKCNEGRLTDDERREYEACVYAIDFLAVLQAKARDRLRRSAAAR